MEAMLTLECNDINRLMKLILMNELILRYNFLEKGRDYLESTLHLKSERTLALLQAYSESLQMTLPYVLSQFKHTT